MTEDKLWKDLTVVQTSPRAVETEVFQLILTSSFFCSSVFSSR